MKIKNYLRSLAVIVATFVSFSANAQTIDGCWEYETKIEGNNLGIRLVIEGKQAIVFMGYEIPNDKVGTVTMGLLSAPTAIKIANNKVEIDPDPKKVTLAVSEVEWTKDIKDAIKEDPSIEEGLIEQIEKSLEASAEKMAEDMMFSGEFTIVKCDKAQLVLKDEDGEVITFSKNDPDSGL